MRLFAFVHHLHALAPPLRARVEGKGAEGDARAQPRAEGLRLRPFEHRQRRQLRLHEAAVGRVDVREVAMALADALLVDMADGRRRVHVHALPFHAPCDARPARVERAIVQAVQVAARHHSRGHELGVVLKNKLHGARRVGAVDVRKPGSCRRSHW